jgi:hypothetical protein
MVIVFQLSLSFFSLLIIASPRSDVQRLTESAALGLSLPCGSFDLSFFKRLQDFTLRALFQFSYHPLPQYQIHNSVDHGNYNATDFITAVGKGQYSTMWVHPSSRNGNTITHEVRTASHAVVPRTNYEFLFGGA